MILNVDESSISNLGISGFGGLIRNADGAWIHGFFGNIGVTNILHAELMAIYRGLLLAWDLNIKDLWCYSDFVMAITLVTKPVDGNACADYLAKLGANCNEVFISIANPPTGLNFAF
ncbi:ribonuclease H [Trifolium pratense]|uniref:Ribonuclease H n=1 Tax=Trifolium pratense TaxID=57577 RepID=A0A2K3NUF4_TRIPR|nr:ribonuclease H [Trifolium pratense]